jgi:type I site-specific restriction-modification system R (restriction) subunit
VSDGGMTESIIEQAALAWLERLGWTVKHGPEIAPGELAAERSDYGQVMLAQRLQDALAQLNPALPAEALGDALRKLTCPEGPTLEARNRGVHRLLVDGVTIEYRAADGVIRGAQARVLDFDDVDSNDWLAVNQFTVSEHKHTRRPDVVLFINGLPLVLIELKNAADEDATIWSAFQQLQTYKAELPSLFAFNAALVVSDGVEARIGTFTAGREWFKPWRTIWGESLADPHLPELQVILEGVFDKPRLLDLVRHFIVFEDAGGGPLVKKMAGYHQFHAVNVAVAETLRAAQLQQEADRVAEGRGGYEAGQRPGGHPGDRHPTLSERRNIVVIADEAHRSQYDFIDGFARHMRDALPNASFIGFTGTPIEKTDANTRAVFGDYISVYDIQRAVEDQATVPIYYESRLAKLALEEAERPKIDPDFEEVTEGEEVERKEKLKSKWAQLEAIVGSEKRLKLIAQDIIEHFETRLEAMTGKAMVVCMSRRICVELYREIVALRPEWHHEDDDKGAIKVVMTGSAADPLPWQPHIRNKPRREALANRFRDADDPLTMVLVRDMWLTGFDAPSLHTMYVDKPMRGHGLMQAIARVNRVFRDKPGGLVVVYLGLAHELKQALATYTESGGTGHTALDQAEAVAVMLEKYEVCCGLFHGFDRSAWVIGTPAERLGLLPAAQEHILAQEDGKNRLLHAVQELSQAFALAVPHDEALRICDEVAFMQAVRAGLVKRAPGEAKTAEELDLAVRQIVSRAVASEGVVDIFAAAGLQKPDVSILSDEFLVQARSFVEMLEQTLRRYQNRAIEAAQVIEELIGLAKDMRAANARGEALGLSDEELAFYDALAVNDSAVQVLGEPTLKTIARELTESVRRNVTIDWTVRENVRAQLRVRVKRILRKYGYPPDKQEQATQPVLEQAEVFSHEWAAA